MKPVLIDDPRLTSELKRIRTGSIQKFYTGSDPRDWKRYRAEGGNIGKNVEMHDKPDTFLIKPPRRELYAKLIDGKWYWINGCAECNGKPRDWMTYIECDKHNVCRTCGISRAQLTASPYGHKDGWQCKPCAIAEYKTERLAALKAFAVADYDDNDFHYNDVVICPHCALEYTPEDNSDHERNQICGRCGGEYIIEAECSWHYSTKIKGRRQTA